MTSRPNLVACVEAAACACALALAAPALAAPGRLGGGDALGVSLGRVVAALVICLIIAGLAILMLRQRQGKVDLAGLFARIELKPRSLKVVETRRLSQHADLCLVRYGEEEFLLLLMAGAAQVLVERKVAGEAEGEVGAACD